MSIAGCGVGSFNLCINQGATYTQQFQWLVPNGTAVGAAPVPVNLTGYTAALQIKNWPGGTLLFDCGPYLTISGTTITLSIPGIVTKFWTFVTGVYSLLLSDSSYPVVVTELLAGTVTVITAITTTGGS